MLASVLPGRRTLRGLAATLVLVSAACSSGRDLDPSMSGDGASDRPGEAATEGIGFAPLPTALTEVAGARLADAVIVVGGLDRSGRAVRDVFFWSPEVDEWESGPPLPIALHHTQVVEADGRAWVIGGFTAASDGSGAWIESAAVFSLGPTDSAWRAERELPAPVGALGAAATDDGTIVAMGGVSGGAVVGDTFVLRPGAEAWERGPELSEPREHLAATTIGGRVLAIGGRVGGLESNKSSVESWDPAGREGSWRGEPPLQERRGGIDADGRCVGGGEEPGATIASIECLDADGDGWSVVADLAVARHGLATVMVDGRLHVVAGGDQPGLFVTAAHEAFALPG